MIIGATKGRGGNYLARHLEKTEENESVLLTNRRGLSDKFDIYNSVSELTKLASSSKSKRPLLHVHYDPSKLYSEDEWVYLFKEYENEFKLQNADFVEITHVKHGREHKHRVYNLVKDDGTLIKLDFDYARNEKIARLAEINSGEELTNGHFTKSVKEALNKEGRTYEAQKIEQIVEQKRKYAISPDERYQQKKSGINKNSVVDMVVNAYKTSDDVKSFISALKESGLRVEKGRKCLIVIDPENGTHALNRLFTLKNEDFDKVVLSKFFEDVEASIKTQKEGDYKNGTSGNAIRRLHKQQTYVRAVNGENSNEGDIKNRSETRRESQRISAASTTFEKSGNEWKQRVGTISENVRVNEQSDGRNERQNRQNFNDINNSISTIRNNKSSLKPLFLLNGTTERTNQLDTISRSLKNNHDVSTKLSIKNMSNISKMRLNSISSNMNKISNNNKNKKDDAQLMFDLLLKAMQRLIIMIFKIHLMTEEEHKEFKARLFETQKQMNKIRLAEIEAKKPITKEDILRSAEKLGIKIKKKRTHPTIFKNKISPKQAKILLDWVKKNPEALADYQSVEIIEPQTVQIDEPERMRI